MVLLIVLQALLILPFSLADDLYMHESLDIKLDVTGSWELQTKREPAQANSVSAEMFLVPQADFRQEVVRWESTGTKTDDGLGFTWAKPVPDSATFGYTTTVHTKNTYLPVSREIAFPLSSAQLVGMDQYLQPTLSIDSLNPAIIKQAAELTEGHTDLFKATFAMASWVEENVKYDLNSLTAQASQKASWVLENKQGVCDEMTSLFIAMARSQGIPARFVSGISYTTSDLFDEPWQPHGWAEVYFPTIGWVPFDITFGEYGYIDVTHVKMRESPDPTTSGTTYQWFGNNINLETTPLKFDVNIVGQGAPAHEPLQLEYTVLDDQVEFGSYNLIKASVKNTANSYTGTTIHLAAPEEVVVLGRNRRTLLLTPQEVRETYWVVRTPTELDSSFLYHYPFLIYTEKNMSIQGTFTAKPGSVYYSEQQINSLTVQDEEKSYSRQVDLTCDMPSAVRVGDVLQAKCTLTNRGDQDLSAVEFCVEKECTTQNVKRSSSTSITLPLATTRPGFTHLVLTAQNDLVEKRVRFPYLVTDSAGLNVTLNVPASASRDELLPITVILHKNSFTTPRNVRIILEGAGFEHTWTLDQLDDNEKLVLELTNPPLAFTNTYSVLVEWSDEKGVPGSTTTSAVIEGKAKTWQDNVIFFFNAITGILS